MTFLKSHVVLMFIYAVVTALFFSLLWKHGKQERIRFFFLVFASLFLGGIGLSWIMYPFPLR